MHACFALKSTVNGWNRLVMVTKDSLEVCASISEALGASEEVNLGGKRGRGVFWPIFVSWVEVLR